MNPALPIFASALIALFLLCGSGCSHVPQRVQTLPPVLSISEMSSPATATLQQAVHGAWREITNISHPLLRNAVLVKPEVHADGRALVAANINFSQNAAWNPKGGQPSTSAPVPLDPKAPHLFIQLSLGRVSPLAQPHVRSREFLFDGIDYNLLITVASSDLALSNRIESILTKAFTRWLPPGVVGANLPGGAFDLNPQAKEANEATQSDDWAFSEAYRGLTPLSAEDAKARALRECQQRSAAAQNEVFAVTPVESNPNYFQVFVRGKLGAQTITNSVFVHRFNAKADKIDQPNIGADEPSIKKLLSLLGRSIDDPAVTNFANQYGLKRYYKFDEGGFRKSDGSFSLWYRRDRIEGATISTVRIPEISTIYQGKIPYRIRASDSPQDIRKKMGKPWEDSAQKSGGGALRYRRDRMEITFAFDGEQLDEITFKSANQ